MRQSQYDQKIHAALDKHFLKHRLVFWYDEGGSRRDVFDSYAGGGVRKVAVANDEFAVKYRILRKEPENKFLVYVPGPRPKDETNWFLDQILTGFVFATDEVAWIVQDLELDQSLEEVVAEHVAFFENKSERLDPLRVLLGKYDSKPTPDRLRRLMLSVLASDTKAERDEERDFKDILFKMLAVLAAPEDSRPDYLERIRRYGLEDFFWAEVKNRFSYSADTPSLESFLASLFHQALGLSLNSVSGRLARQAFTFLDEWRNSMKYAEAYAVLSEKYARELNVKQVLQEKSIDELFGVDLFKEADRFIVRKLAENAAAGTLNPQEALQRITERRGSYWVKSDTERKVTRFYDCLAAYLRFHRETASLEGYSKDPVTFWNNYSRAGYRVDTEYRLFVEELLEIS